MTVDEILTKFLPYRKKIILSGVVVSLVIMTLALWARYAVVVVAVESQLDSTAQISVFSSSHTGVKKAIGMGAYLIPRETKSIIVSRGEYVKTQSEISIAWHGLTHEKIELRQDYNAKKMAFNGNTGEKCATYSANIQRLMYFSCNNPKSLFEYQTPTDQAWFSKKTFNLSYNGDVDPYQGGIIGLSLTNNTDTTAFGGIVVVTETKQVSFLNLPEGVDSIRFVGAKIFTDTQDLTNNRFVLADTQGNIYLGTPTENSGVVTYTTIPAPDDFTAGFNHTLCTLSGDSVNCYYGESPYGDRPEDFDRNNITKNQIYSYVFGSSDKSSMTINKEDFVLHDFIQTTNGEFFGRSHKTLYHFQQKNSEFVAKEVSQNVDSIAGTSQAYFVQDNGVYAFDEKTNASHQVFFSPNILPQRLYAADGKLFIIGTIKNGFKSTYAYELTQEPNTQPGNRLLDILPMPATKLPDTTNSDFIDDRILVTLKVTVWKNAPSVAEAIDQVSLETKKHNVIEALRSHGAEIDESQIQFTY